MSLNKFTTYAWTDSMIVIAWIKGNPNNFKTFVANRISEIHGLTKPSQWNHTISTDNPADCATRGIHATKLALHSLWWNGPNWLKYSAEKWPTLQHTLLTTDVPDLRKITVAMATLTNPIVTLFDRFSELYKLQRVVTYCLRFINKRNNRLSNTSNSSAISAHELNEAFKYIIKIAQALEYKEELRALTHNIKISNKSKILSLNPFLDEEKILRVGGRIQNSALPHEEIHPIIMPQNHPVTKLLIRDAHIKTLHGGTQLTLAHIRKRIWITNGRNAVRLMIRQCIRCHRYKQHTGHQLMGNLPIERVRPSRPFSKCGVDYAGPIQIRTSKGRGNKSYKGYIAIFVCLATKALHIEIVSDQTSSAFIAAFKRFTARRGQCHDMFSDNGTNFIGANRALTSDHKKAIEEANTDIQSLLAKNGTTWHFIPPAAAHFGGIWEAGVKSVKTHLKRVIGESTLTFEELTTVVTQIEACLNSRPLTAMTSDPTDLTVLTPGHFLIGDSLLSPPEPSLANSNQNSLQRWKLISKMYEDFWKSWSRDYLHTLQQRQKWQNPQQNIRVNDLVLIKEDNIPPSQWHLGRITDVHPGTDNKVRVVTLRGPGKGPLKRPITKLALLPIPSEETPIKEPSIKTTSPQTTLTANIACATKRKAPHDEYNKIKNNFQPNNTARYWMRGQNIDHIKGIAKEMESNKIKCAKRKGTIKPYTGNKFFLYTITVLCLIIQCCWTLKITPVNQSGILFAHAKTHLLQQSTWKLIINTNINTTVDIDTLTSCLDEFNTLCIKTTQLIRDKSCIDDSQHISRTIQYLERKLSSLNLHRVKRSKGILGYLGEFLFGKSASEEIADVKIRQRDQNRLSFKTLEVMKQIEKREKSRVEQFKTKINDAINHINDIQQWYNTINHNVVQLNMVQATESLGIIVAEYTAKYQALQDSNLISDDELKAHLSSIAQTLHTDVKIPDHVPERELLSLCPYKINLKNSTVQIEIDVPIISKDEYETFNIIYAPNISDGTIIQEVHNTISVNHQKESFFYPQNHGYELPLDAEHIIIINHKIYHNTNNCITDILFSKKHPHACNTGKLTNIYDKWIELPQTNQFFFYTTTPEDINIYCNTSRSTVPYQMGIIVLDPDCHIKTKTTIISAQANAITTTKQLYFKSSPIKITPPTVQPYRLQEVNTLKIETHSELDGITRLQEAVNESLIPLERGQSSLWARVTIGVGVTASITAIALVFCLHWWRRPQDTAANQEVSDLPEE